MQFINYNTILNRNQVSSSLKNILNQFEKNKHKSCLEMFRLW